MSGHRGLISGFLFVLLPTALEITNNGDEQEGHSGSYTTSNGSNRKDGGLSVLAKSPSEATTRRALADEGVNFVHACTTVLAGARDAIIDDVIAEATRVSRQANAIEAVVTLRSQACGAVLARARETLIEEVQFAIGAIVSGDAGTHVSVDLINTGTTVLARFGITLIDIDLTISASVTRLAVTMFVSQGANILLSGRTSNRIRRIARVSHSTASDFEKSKLLVPIPQNHKVEIWRKFECDAWAEEVGQRV